MPKPRPLAREDEELTEFASLEPVPVDPRFREELREELWQLVQRVVAEHAPEEG
jgi:hypothetical protein